MTADSESGAEDLDDHLKKAFITMTLDMKATRAAQQHNKIILFLVVSHDEDIGTLRWLLCVVSLDFKVKMVANIR